MYLKILFVLFIVTSISNEKIEKTYAKTYNKNGAITAEGWMMGEAKVQFWKYYHINGQVAAEGHYSNNKKSGYWYFYTPDGKVIKEGHYEAGIAENWWIFYDLASKSKRKIQYQNNQKNGFCLVYKNRKLQKVEKYTHDIYKGEWTDIRNFKKDNPDVSLY